MREAVGDALLERALAKLPPSLQAEYAAIRPESWVPLDLSAQVIDAVASEAGRDRDLFFEEMVRAGSLRSINRFYRTLLRFAWDEMLVARAAGSYSHIRNVGRFEATLISAGDAVAYLRDWPNLTERAARSMAYTMEAFILAAGKREVKVTVTLDPPLRPGDAPSSATYRCRWRGAFGAFG
jgi:hypothetical protein